MINDDSEIEFVGIPGTGKTSITDSLIPDLSKKVNNKIIQRKDLLITNLYSSKISFIFSLLVFTILNFRLSFFIFVDNIFPISKKQYKRTLLLFFKLVCINKINSKRKKNIILFDQGICQLLWSLFLYKKNKKKIRQYLIRINRFLPNIVIFVQSNNHIEIINRVDKRNNDIKPIDYRQVESSEKKEEILRYLVQVIEKENISKVLYLNALNKISVNKKKVLSFLTSLNNRKIQN
jgi:hypothetical protein